MCVRGVRCGLRVTAAKGWRYVLKVAVGGHVASAFEILYSFVFLFVCFPVTPSVNHSSSIDSKTLTVYGYIFIFNV